MIAIHPVTPDKMENFHLHMGNRLETLVSRLADTLSERPLSSPFKQEIIVVQSLGMQKWLSMELSARFGIWTNCRYPFPNAFVNESFDAVLGPVKKSTRADYYERSPLTWAIMRCLPGLSAEKGFDEIRAYLAGHSGPLKLMQLSSRIADCFDQYLTYRPDLVTSWDAGEERHWQARLWRAVTADAPVEHRALRRKDFFSAIRRGDTVLSPEYPERISIFGIPSLPPFHLEVLAALASRIDVHVYFLNPCREYWGDITSHFEQSRIAKKTPGGRDRREMLHLESGNALLASMGKLGRDFLDLLTEIQPPGYHESFDGPSPDAHAAILQVVQNDILTLTERTNGGRDSGNPPVEIDSDSLKSDGSITVHSCHGPMREAEVLKDYLLDLFNDTAHPIAPDEILVLTPDIEGYAPYIEAAFAADTGCPAIPCTIADRPLRNESPLAGMFLSLLELAVSRFEASRITDLLEFPRIRLGFGIEEDDLPLVRRWIADARIHWAYDESDKERLGLPPFRENTWRAGLDRMLLGFAMPDTGALFEGILPYDAIEGNDALLLGKFAAFIRALRLALEELRGERTLPQWRDTLMKILETFFLSGAGTEEDTGGVEEIINGLETLAGVSRFDSPVDFTVMRAHMAGELGRSLSSRNFLGGSVTFCAMLPMRSIPFRVICMIGMNGDLFPRQDRSLNFNLMADAPLKGDRSLRDEDRYLFLEALISAREKLFISYTGQSIEDSAEIPPSIVVSELIDHIEGTFSVKGGKPGVIRDLIVTKHPLQPFSPRYFDGSGLFSYSAENCEASSKIEHREKPRPFISGPLDCTAVTGTADAGEILSFFDNPARFLLRESLGIRLFGSDEGISDSEPFEMGGLERYGIEDRLCRALIRGEDIGPLEEAFRASGELPHGTPGDLARNDITSACRALASRITPLTGKSVPRIITLTAAAGGLAIRGTVRDVYGNNHIRFRPAGMKGKDLLRGWLLHLLISLREEKGEPVSTIIIARKSSGGKQTAPDGALFPPISEDEALHYLEPLAGLFLRGRGELVPLIPECSLAFAMAIKRGDDVRQAVDEASKAWRSGFSGIERGEFSDPFYNLCYGRLGDEERFNAPFRETAGAVFSPLLDRMKEAPV